VPSHRLLELDSRTLEATIASNPLLILPIGALEAHGPHLPLGADQIQAEATSASLAATLPALIAPTIPYGACSGASGFPGTVHVPLPRLAKYTRSTLDSFGRMGFQRVLVLSGHAERGHMAALREAAERAQARRPGFRVGVVADYEFVYELRGTLAPETDGHGGLLETSRVLALAPQTVGPLRPAVVNRTPPHLPGPPSHEQWPESVQGDTRNASAEIGQRIQQHVLARLSETVAHELGE
jgi:creatinine amidohydrolase